MKTIYHLFFLFILSLFFFPRILKAQEENSDSITTDSTNVFLQWEDFEKPYFSQLSPVKREFHFYLDNEMITYERYKDDIFIDFYKILSMDDFIKHYSELSMKQIWIQQIQKMLKQNQGTYTQGLVPDIELPKIKTPISGIIGEGGKLSVQGSEKIDFGGQKTRYFERTHYPGESRSILPELKMKQTLNVNLQGTVGQKINVFINHNSEAESDLQNKIKLQYKGNEDEIIQLIEAGDTDMNLPGTKVIGALPSYKGLFGIKTLAKVGPVDITAVASKEQGETQQTTFVGQAKQDTIKRWDVSYDRRQFFFLDMNFSTNDTITDLDVYIDDRNYTNDSIAIPAECYINADTLDTTLFYSGMFDRKLPTTDYELYSSNVLYLNYALEKEYVLAVRYIKKNKTTNIADTVGSFPQDDTLILKLIKPENNSPSYPTWNYELRNIYSLGTTDIANIDEVSIEIKKYNAGAGIDSSTQNGIPYTKLLGIDIDQNGYVDRTYIDDRGFIIFPNPLPFADSVLTEPNSIIYDTTSSDEQLGKYYMEISYKGAKTSIGLGQLNIIEGSEVVKVNGITLQRDIDYTIDYTTGTIEFKGNGATLIAQPGAKLTIDYQYAPFFSTASKSLVGMRAEYNLSSDNKIGTSWIYRNISTFDERPKLGQEPRSVVVGEIDGTITTHPNFLTTLCDKIPFIETEEPSQTNISGVIAMSRPDPNSMGEVYIDDMEGVKQSIGIGASMWLWHYGSVPSGKDTASLGKYYWYEPVREEWIKKGDIFPNLPSDQKDDLTSYLRIVFYPKNNDPNSWMSILNLISKTGEDLTKSRFLEFWVKGNQGTLHFDIGRSIPEDAPRWTINNETVGFNGIIDSEDKNKDGMLDKNEDTGLDGINGTDGDNIPEDDGNDDYPHHTITPADYRKLNGTENNDRLDSEDLDRDGSLNNNPRYTEYSISLENPDSQYIAEETEKGWRLFRIPLDDTLISQKIGQMDWEFVKYVRLWIDGFTRTDSLQVYSIEITGTTWENKGILSQDTTSVSVDEKLFVTQKNTEENPDYTPPFDPGTDQYGRPKREQSLVLKYENIKPEHFGSVFMQMAQSEDYTTYKSMKLYVRCKEGQPENFYIKIGGDSTTYYKFEKNISNTWEEITIPFKALTDLKVEAPEDTFYKKGNYSFRNNPSLTNVRYIELGFVNNNDADVSGEMWIDEIRLSSPRRDKGISMNLTGQLKIADFITINGSLSKTDADFQQLNMNKLSQSNKLDYQYNGIVALGKFFPKMWGFNIPLTYNENKSVGYPKYKTGSDIILDNTQAKKEKNENYSKETGISFNKGTKSINLFSRLILDPLKVNASRKFSYSLSPTYLDSIRLNNLSGSYSFSPQLKPIKFLKLFDLYYLPQNFSTSAGYSRNWSHQFTRQTTGWVMTSHDLKRYLNLSRGFQYKPFSILSSNYSVNETRDLDINYEIDTLKKRFGEVINLNKTLSTSLSPTFGDWTRPSLSFSTNYSEDRKPENRTMVTDSFPVRNVGNNNILTLSADFAISKLIKKLTRLRNVSKDSTALTGSPRWIAIKIEQLSNYISRPTISISRNRRTNFGLLKQRPDWEYQFGLREGIPKELKYPKSKVRVTTYDQKVITDNLTTSSGISTALFTLSISYTTNKNTSKTPSSEQTSKSTTWPDLNLQLPNLMKFIPKNELLKDASGSLNYRIDRASNTIVNQGTQTESNSISWGPSFQMTWLRDIRTNLSANYSTTKSSNYTGTFYQTTSKTTGYNFSLSYSFRAPTGLRFPWIGQKIHFSSNLDAGLDLNYTKNFAFSSQFPEPTSYTINYNISPRLSYNFSENITGGLIGNYSMLNDKKQNNKSSTTGLDVWVEFKF